MTDIAVSQDHLPIALYSAERVRELDRVAIEEFEVPGLTLMRRAAGACVEALYRRWHGVRKITVFCGSGNNAGDGYIVAGMLAERGRVVQVIVVGDPDKLGADAAEGYRYCRASGATLVDFGPDVSVAGDVIVDALLGTGLSGSVRTRYLEAIETVNDAGKPVLSVDVPSGLCADTGNRLGAAVEAQVTVTFIGVKQGLLTMDGPDCAGDVVFAGLDVPDGVYERVAPSARRLDFSTQVRTLPRRPRNAHKNKFGHVLIVGGDEGMGGAAAMSGESALRAGCGLVSVVTSKTHVDAILARRPELMVRGVDSATDVAPLLARASVVVLGPGLGRSAWSQALFKYVMQATGESELPVVLDADGLNLLALTPVKRDNWILTPHPGEAGNLLQDTGIQTDRFGAVANLQAKYGGVALIKGAGTVITDGNRLSVCSDGNPGMSTAGMGDVLSGVIGGLLAQHLPPMIATELGVAAHARAGDVCVARAGERGLIATDLIPEIRRLLNPPS